MEQKFFTMLNVILNISPIVVQNLPNCKLQMLAELVYIKGINVWWRGFQLVV